jgi:hypothetical protein
VPVAIRRPVTAVLAVLVVLLATACEVRVDVRIEAQTDGSGVVTVAVGLDQGALDRLGDPATQLRVDDLRQAGWGVTGPEQRDDGFTWVEASKAFATVEEMQLVVEEVTGPSGVLRDLAIEEGETDAADTYRLTGTVDLSAGLAAFADPAVAEALGGDAFGGVVQDLEAAEGRPVAEMIDVRVTASIGDEVQVLAPTLGGDPQQIDVTEEVPKPISLFLWLGIGAVVLGGLAGVLVVARRRFRDPRR